MFEDDSPWTPVTFWAQVIGMGLFGSKFACQGEPTPARAPYPTEPLLEEIAARNPDYTEDFCRDFLESIKDER